MDIVTAITGAIYAQRFIHGLVGGGVNVHPVIPPRADARRRAAALQP